MQQRQASFRKGLQGLWDRVRGEHRKIREQNELEAWQALQRDRTQTDGMIFQHLDQRRTLRHQQTAERRINDERGKELAQDRDRFGALRTVRDGTTRDGPSFER
ncbi:hypothetical protein [Tropicimonas sp. IMCC6043]|uniref:hypothetical protein n=1 Tax=Tropicimonas sp. IMCC6043 TaxID=2510645 RepID=UPI001A92525A|nr:hypothetical protein [Tropicimonas sp. IMCC6043]